MFISFLNILKNFFRDFKKKQFMQKTFFYWAPFLTHVGTVKSTINSAISLSKYSKSNYQPIIINSCGEWDQYLELFKTNKIKVINLYNFSYSKFLPKYGFLNSRLSYIIIFLLSFFPLLKLLKKNENCYLIAHLITSLPIFLFNNFKIRNKLVLRISGLPKLNLIRKNFWKKNEKNINIVTCPSVQLLNKLKTTKIFPDEKIYFLPDAIYQLKDFLYQKKNNFELKFIEGKKKIISIGRLTRQKNFGYLIDEFSEFCKKEKGYNLYILGEGEERKNLEYLIKQKNLKNSVFLLGNTLNVFEYINNADLFILSSLWEDPGFVLIESGLGNLFVISSNCPNGPEEILEKGKNGLLYQSNQKDALKEALIQYSKIGDEKKIYMRKNLKKNISKYSIFRHYLAFTSIFK